MQKTKQKAKKVIHKFDFSSPESTVALVGDVVGGAANGYSITITKSKRQFSEDFIKKATMVSVTMNINEYLEKFFGLYYEQAEILARSLGFQTQTMDYEMQEKSEEEKEEKEYKYSDWIDEKVKSIKVMKSLHESENFDDAFADMLEDEFLELLQEQEQIEKALITLSAKETSDVEKSTEVAPLNASGVGKGDDPVVKSKSKEKLMKRMEDNKEVPEVQAVEMIEKSKFESIEKQALETQELLKAALAELELFKAEKQAMIAKARKAAVKEAVKSEDKAEALYKSIEGLADEHFNSVLSIFKSLSEQVEKSAMFQEQGAAVESTEQVQESAVARILKAQFTK